jgi:RNA polymerase sigma-70 factor (ECF subfamily)
MPDVTSPPPADQAPPSPDEGGTRPGISTSTADRPGPDGNSRVPDPDAFRVLYRDIQPRILWYLTALVGHDAEDVASETWLHVARDLHGFHGDSDGFRGWVTTIARHRATDHLRRHGRRPQVLRIPVEEFGHLAGGDDTAASALDTVATDAAIALIARLPADQAEAVLLRVVIGLDAEAAGKVLGKRAALGQVLHALPTAVAAHILHRLPVSVLSQLPASVLSQLPASVLSQLPASVLSSLPPSVLSGLPVSVLSGPPV